MTENTGAIQAGRFGKGVSGNPIGKPKSARNKTTLAVEALFDGEAEELTRTCIERAKSGDSKALRLVMERICPPMRERAVSLDLPKIETANDVLKAIAAIVASVAGGELTPGEAGDIVRIVETFAKAIDSADLERRIAELEKRQEE